MMKRYFLSVVMMVVTMNICAQEHFVRNLWNGKPHTESVDKADTARVHVFLPNSNVATGRAVVILPGGGYEHLAMGHEGTDWAPFFTNQGIAVVVVKYRMPHGNRHVPISDAEEAIRMVRRNAEAWNVNPSLVGIMGFSAGGHLAATVATHAQGQARPDFQILFYPVITMDRGYTHMGSHDNLLGKNAARDLEDAFSNELQVSADTPKAFIVLSDDDDVVPPANGVNYYQALLQHHVEAALHVYPSGGHGYGINNYFRYHYEMLTELKAWLAKLKPTANGKAVSFSKPLWPKKPAVKSSDKNDVAQVHVFLPKPDRATGRAVVILPGGAYGGLAIDNEGFGWTRFFNDLGIAAIVLKYRMPHGNPNVPVSDAEEAMKLVRRHAKEWRIDPAQVGIMGSSAGGHLASTIATQSKDDARPDFQILFYPVISMDPALTHMGSHDNLLGTKKVKKSDEARYSSDVQVTRHTPRAFITFANDDSLVNPDNGINYYLQLYRNDVPASLYIFPDGEHGYGSQTTFRYHSQLLMELESWLRSF